MKSEIRRELLSVFGFLYGAYRSGSHEVFQRLMNSPEFATRVIEPLSRLIKPTDEELADILERARKAKMLAEPKPFGSPPVKISELVELLAPLAVPVALAAAGIGYFAGRRKKKKQAKGATR